MLILRWMKRFELNRPQVLGLLFAHLLLLLLVVLLVLGTVPVSAHAAASADIYNQKIPLLPQEQIPSTYFGQAVAVSADGTTMLVSAPGENNTSGAVYVYSKPKPGSSWIFQTKLGGNPPFNTNNFPSFGNAVALSADGNTALIGSRYEAGWQGAVYVYVRTGINWYLQARLTAAISQNGDYFGSAVSLSADGNTALIGAEASHDFNGSAFVFKRTESVWTQSAQLLSTEAAQFENTFFGHTVSLSGDGKAALVGAPYQGAAYVYQLAGANWNLQQKITGASIGDAVSFASDGNSLLVSAIGVDGFRGAAFIYGKSGATWTQQAQLTVSGVSTYTKLALTAALSADGNTALLGTAAQTSAYVFKKSNTGWGLFQQIAPANSTSTEGFGAGLALSGNGATALVGVPGRGAGANTNVGAAYIYELGKPIPAGNFVQKNKFLLEDQSAPAAFGEVVAASADGNTMLVSSPRERGYNGSVYVYIKSGGNWNFQTKLAGDPPAGPGQFITFGDALAISADGNTVLAASSSESSTQGVVYVFVRNGNNWSRQTKLVADVRHTSDAFGSAVTLSADGNTALIGAVGYTHGVGAAYIFTRTANTWAQQTKLLPTDVPPSLNANFGTAVALSDDGQVAVVGATQQTAAYIYRRNNLGWNLEQKIVDTTPGANTGLTSAFGNSVSIAGDGATLIIGAVDTNAWRSLVYIFTKKDASWTQQSQLVVDGIRSPRFMDVTLALNKNASLIALTTEQDGVLLFKKSGTEWNIFQSLNVTNPVAEDKFGRAVALSGNGATIVVGAPGQALNLGAAYVFEALTPNLALSASNPTSVEGRAVTFSAKLINFSGTGKLTFTVDGVAAIAPTTVIDDGKTFQYTANLALGTHSVSATFESTSGETVLSSNTAPHLVTTLCDGVLVTLATDDGSGVTCGSFSRAVKNAATIGVSTPMVTFALEGATQVQLTGQANFVLPANVAIDGGAGVVLNGNNQAGDGLLLSGHNSLKGLTIKGFAGRELVLNGQENVFEHVVVLS